jgi:hypothetical protein
LHNDFAESLLTRGLSPLPVCVLDNEQLIFKKVGEENPEAEIDLCFFDESTIFNPSKIINSTKKC